MSHVVTNAPSVNPLIVARRAEPRRNAARPNRLERLGLASLAAALLSSSPASAQRIVTVAPFEVEGTLSREVVRRVVLRHLLQLRMCYTNGLRARPALRGRSSIRFVIGIDGTVTHASNDGSTLPSPAVQTCMIAVYRRMQFPSPEAGRVTVRSSMDWAPPAE